MPDRIAIICAALLLAAVGVQGQTENSPYSRYGLGDQLSSQNIMSRAIGGVSAAYADILTVNFANPASYARLKRSTFDFGLELDSRTQKTLDPPRKFSSYSPMISYIQLGLPLSQSRNWGMNLGLRPLTRISYSLERNERVDGIDSIRTLFEGSGGAYEVYTGTGFSLGPFQLGFNIGYLFGTKSYETRRYLIPDSLFNFYYPSQHKTRASFGGLFGTGGLQYTLRLGNRRMVRLGAYGSLSRNLNATREEVVQTFREGQAGIDSIDVVSRKTVSGEIVYPSQFGAGLIYHGRENWLIGADYTQSSWDEYRYFGDRDSVQNAWKFHLGGQFVPNLTNASSYWGRVTYRAGATFGQDHIRVGSDMPAWSISLGLGLPMRPPAYSNQYSIINATLEFGQRGNNLNLVRESFFRLALGLTLSDIWFIKRKYD